MSSDNSDFNDNVAVTITFASPSPKLGRLTEAVVEPSSDAVKLTTPWSVSGALKIVSRR